MIAVSGLMDDLSSHLRGVPNKNKCTLKRCFEMIVTCFSWDIGNIFDAHRFTMLKGCYVRGIRVVADF